ncbi:MAG: hypothetical protein ACOYOB_14090 [Myxococcota bacterium]
MNTFNRPMSCGLGLLALSGALLLAPTSAHGFALEVHQAVTTRALEGRKTPGPVAMATVQDQAAFFAWMVDRMRAEGDDGSPERARFRKRFPPGTAVDAFDLKGFFGFGQHDGPGVVGLDRAMPGGPETFVRLLVQASVQPDLDARNQSRLASNPDRTPLRLPDGRLVPFDPMTLNMGAVDGLSSQAHAHYQLGADHPSDSVETLQRQPWNFVLATGFPGPVETYAAAMAAMHLDLAIAARQWGVETANPAGMALAGLWLGAGLHYVQDVTGPLHTVQVGSYDLFKRAKIASWIEALRTGGGVWGTRRGFVSIGLGFLHNHHMMAEQWLSRELVSVLRGQSAHPAVVAAWQKAQGDDPAVVQAMPTDRGELVMQTLAGLGAKDGAELYAAALAAGAPKLTDPDYRIGDEETLGPDHLGDPSDPLVKAALDHMATLHGRSLLRAVTASRRYYEVFEHGEAGAALTRLRKTRLDALDAAEARRATYLKHPPPAATDLVEPIWAVGEGLLLVLLVGGVAWGVQRRRRRVTERQAAAVRTAP